MAGQMVLSDFEAWPKALSSQVVFKPRGKMHWVTLAVSPPFSESFHSGHFLGYRSFVLSLYSGPGHLLHLTSALCPGFHRHPPNNSVLWIMNSSLLGTFWYSKPPTYEPSNCELSKMWTCIRVSSHISGVHWHVCASSTHGYAFVYFIVQYCIEYTSAVSLF